MEARTLTMIDSCAGRILGHDIATTQICCVRTHNDLSQPQIRSARTGWGTIRSCHGCIGLYRTYHTPMANTGGFP